MNWLPAIYGYGASPFAFPLRQLWLGLLVFSLLFRNGLVYKCHTKAERRL